MSLNIQPYSRPGPVAVSVRRTQVRTVEPIGERNYAVVDGELLDANGERIDGISYCMTPDEYDAWGSDDLYPTTLLITKNGLTAA